MAELNWQNQQQVKNTDKRKQWTWSEEGDEEVNGSKILAGIDEDIK